MIIQPEPEIRLLARKFRTLTEPLINPGALAQSNDFRFQSPIFVRLKSLGFDFSLTLPQARPRKPSQNK